MFGRNDALPVHGGKRADNGVSFSVVNMRVRKSGTSYRISETVMFAVLCCL